jgi:type II secretory pathway component GspD/PulD (secretin)
MAHQANNTVFIEDVKEAFNQIEPLLEELDHVPQQVLIEAKIFEVKLDEDLALGVDWKKILSKGDLSGTVQDSGFANLPGGGSTGLFFTVATPNFQVFLDTLQEKGNLKALATPKLLALNHKPAQIVIGGRLGFRVTTTIDQVTTESVEFLDIGTQLRLTPHIDKDGNIMMDIHPEVSDGTITAGLPTKTTTEVTTTLVAKDGQTIFIGGLIREREEEIRTQVPGLGSVPLLGYPFRRTEIKTTNNEIIVLITPHLDLEQVDRQVIADELKDTQNPLKSLDSIDRSR